MDKEQIRSLLDVSVEAVDYIQRGLGRRTDDPSVSEIIENLRQIAEVVETETCNKDGLLQKVYLYARNTQSSVNEVKRTPSMFERVFSCEIRPFILEMRRLWRLAAEVLPDAGHRERHQLQLMQAMRDLHRAPQERYLYDASIILCAYNKLEYTKAAVESIFAHTDFSSGRVELITINNGSNDGTREYFESLPHTKKVNLKYNVLGFDTAQYIAEGKYYINYSNDVVATPNWIKQLFWAMESDARIAFAVPTCNMEGISNYQGVPVPYRNLLTDMDKMQEFAAAHNRSNAALWEDRALLMPFLSIVRMDVYKQGLHDPIYTRGEFVDDDLSTLLRRTGWRQLLLRDTFMHHFGGVTLGAARENKENNPLEEMRHIYYEKWGVDAWDSRGSFPGHNKILQSWHSFRDGDRVLVLEPRFGGTACDLVNAYRSSNLVPHMTAAVFDERYLSDTDYLFDESIAATRIQDVIEQSDREYNIISAGCYLDELPIQDVIADLEILYDLLTPGGILFLPVRNPGSAYELAHLIYTGKRDVYCGEGEVEKFIGISYHQLSAALAKHSFLQTYKMHPVTFQQDDFLVEQIKALPHLRERSLSDAETSLSVRMFFLGIFKKTA